MRAIALSAGLMLVALAAPVQAGGNSHHGFDSMERCNDYLDRWRTRMARDKGKGWFDAVQIQDGYCVLAPDGIYYTIVWIY